MILTCLAGWGLASISVSACAAEATPQELEFFEQKIRPVLVAHCYECHAADSKQLQAGLLVDSRAGLLAGGDSGPAVVPHDIESSLLISALRYDSFKMPPRGKLPEAVIADFEHWIRSGAADPRTAATKAVKARQIDIEAGRQHWAYQPVRRPAIPPVTNTAWPINEIDRFILAQLEANDLPPAADADRGTLLRRLSFTLTGLPPTPQQLDAFLQDDSPAAYERVVDELLSSPRFGERWGRHWLDVVRFAESVTLRGLILGESWRYRDYVIHTWNEDRPFDRFLVEQLAGDLLPGETREEQVRNRIATTFLTLGNTNLEEQDKKQLELDYVDEQLDVIGRGLLAQTITCARCHDHKFDPIPTRDYYALAGILKNVKALEHANVSRWVEVPLPVPPELQQEVDAHQQAVAKLESAVAQLKRRIAPAAVSSARQVVAIKDLPGVIVDDSEARKVGQWKESQSVASYVGQGYCHDEAAGKGAKTISFIPRLPADGRYEVRYAYTHGTNRAAEVPVTIFSADGEKTILINQQEPPPLDGHFVSLGNYRFEVAGQSFVLVTNADTTGHVVADAVQFLPLEPAPPAVQASPLAAANKPATTATATVVADADANSKSGSNQPPAGNAQPNTAPAQHAASLQPAENDPAALKKQLAQLEAELNQLKKARPAVPLAMSVVELGKGEDLAIRIRGNGHNLGEVAPRGVLQVASWGPAPAMPTNASGRLELAQWLVDPHHPLTARVLVNRVWHWVFGAGLVRTVDHFGTTGETPSHPELLDYLATRFVDEGWSIKRLVRTLVLSHTYRQISSGMGPANDPENRLLSRMHRQRLQAESLRDGMLDMAGVLDLTIGGKTFPANLASDYQYEYTALRRSVYIPVFRNSLPEIFEAFDFANPSLVVGRRDVSTVAPQALFLLNHPFVREQAERTARRLLSDRDADLRTRLDLAYRLTLSRSPTAAEMQLGEQFLQSFAEPPAAVASAAVASATEPTATEPTAAEPTAAEPAATEPTAAEPTAATKPASTASATTETPAPTAAANLELEAWTQLVHSLFASVEYRYLR